MRKHRLISVGTASAFLAAAVAARLFCPGSFSAAPKWGTVDMLVAREAIRDKIALYSLLHDGDGAARDGRRWADAIWTTDASLQVIDQGGQRLFGNGEIGMVGRETILKAFGGGVPSGVDFALRHVLTNVAFDSLTPDSSETRLVEFNIRGVKSQQAAQGTPVAPQGSVDVYIMHDTWRREGDGEWRKSRSVVYCVVSCPQISIPASK